MLIALPPIRPLWTPPTFRRAARGVFDALAAVGKFLIGPSGKLGVGGSFGKIRLCGCCEFCVVGSSLSVGLSGLDHNHISVCTGTSPFSGGGFKYTALSGVNGSYNVPVSIGMGGAPTCTYAANFTISPGLTETHYDPPPDVCTTIHSTQTFTTLGIYVVLANSTGLLSRVEVRIDPPMIFFWDASLDTEDRYVGDDLYNFTTSVVPTGTGTANP